MPSLPIEFFPLNSPLYMNGFKIDGAREYPMLLKVTKMSFTDANLYESTMSEAENQ